MIYKAAMTLDGSLTVPGERWVSGEESRRLVHELRAQVDAVAVGGGTARADLPAARRARRRHAARPAAAARLLARAAAGRARPRAAERARSTDELRALAAEGVQSLLLEGGPTLAAAFLEADLVDKLLVFVAPTLAGEGPRLVAPLPSPRTLSHLTARPVGGDVLLEAYVHQP